MDRGDAVELIIKFAQVAIEIDDNFLHGKSSKAALKRHDIVAKKLFKALVGSNPTAKEINDIQMLGFGL